MTSHHTRYRTLWMWCTLLTSVAMVMAGCSHKDAEIYRNPDAVIRPMASYALTPTLLGAGPEQLDPRVHNALVHERVRAAIIATLEAKGYQQTAPDVAEFLIQYRVGVLTTEREVGGFVSHRNPAAPSTSGPAAILTVTRSAVTEGNLVIELVERQTGAVVYWAEAYDDNVTPWDASEWIIASLVRVLLQDL